VARNNLAYLLAAHGGSLDEALDLAKDAQLFLPQLTETTDTLGFVYLMRKDSDNALAAFRTVVLKEPGMATYRNHLGAAIEQKGDRSSASEALKVALRAEPTDENQELIKKLLEDFGRVGLLQFR
jgi:tetratricopeptide (TPR) repeat protein